MALRRRTVLQIFGWTYVVYHSLLAIFFVVCGYSGRRSGNLA